MNDPITKGAVERVARIIDPVAWSHEDWRRELAAKRILSDDRYSPVREALEPSLAKAEAILATLNLGELVTALEGIDRARDAMGDAWVDNVCVALARFRGGVSG